MTGLRRPRRRSSIGNRRTPPARSRATPHFHRRARRCGWRSLAATRRGLSTDDFVALLALLEPTALTSTVKRHVSPNRESAVAEAYRDTGVALTGVEPPKLTELHRFSLSSVFLAGRVRVRRLPPGGAARRRRHDGRHLQGQRSGDGCCVTFVVAQLPQFSQGRRDVGRGVGTTAVRTRHSVCSSPTPSLVSSGVQPATQRSTSGSSRSKACRRRWPSARGSSPRRAASSSRRS